MPVVYPARVTEAFARFWAAYPTRPDNPRAPALAVFDRLVKDGEDAEALVVAAGRYAAVAAADGIKGRFLPHARKWLHLRYFDDYLTDLPASAEPAQPAPECPHPMDWARPHVSAAAWTSWFAGLSVVPPVEVQPWTVVAPSAFVRDRVQSEYGHLFRRQFGAVAWRVAPKERP